MTENSQLVQFEDKRWAGRDQQIVWRHQIALELVSEEPVLDVGGGDGLLLELVRQRKNFQELNLLDISPTAVDKAKTKGIKANVHDLAQPLPFADQSLGTVCLLDVLEHLYDPLSVLREAARVGRSVVVTVPNFNYWKYRLQVLGGSVPGQNKPKRGHVYWFNYDIFQNLVREAKLQIDAVVFGGFVRVGPVGGWLSKTRPNLFAHSLGAKLRRI